MDAAKVGMAGYAPVLDIGTGNPEAEKYGKMWDRPEYRLVSPGEGLAQVFLQQARPKPGAEVLDFGCGTGRGALMLAILGRVKVTMIDFVRNALDPEIQEALTTQAETLSFVKADLEQPLPVAAEFGYCTDVMEHIPRDRVDRVLTNILRAARHVFFSISTIPDTCGDLIGEELHMTVEPYSWWLRKLNERDAVIHWSREEAGACFFYVSAWRTGAEIVKTGVLNIDEEQIRKNVAHNIAQGWRQVHPHPTNDLECMILGGGPSLALFEDEIRAKRAEGVKLITLNGAYNWALARGLTPSVQIIVDARAFNARFTKPVVSGFKEDAPDGKVEGTVYLLASQCDPSVFEGLPRDRTYIFHTMTTLVTDLLEAQYGKVWHSIPGGSTVLLRAIPLMRMLGYTKFHLYGCDSCLLPPPVVEPITHALLGRMPMELSEHAMVHHAYAQPENDAAVILPVTTQPGGRVFYCHGWHVSQAQEFMDLLKMLGDVIELNIVGDGLLAYILKTGAEMEVEDTEGASATPEERKPGVTLTLRSRGALPPAAEVVPGLWVGGVDAVGFARERGLAVLGVRHIRHDGDDVWIPVLVGNHRVNLDAAATAIERFLSEGRGVLVHCLVGVERAPLTVAWFLHTRRGMTLDDAYALVKEKRPVVQDRRQWIDGENLQGADGVVLRGEATTLSLTNGGG